MIEIKGKKTIKENVELSDTLNPTVWELLCKQVEHELQNSLIYNQLSCLTNNAGLFGFSKFFKQEAIDEYDHANKIVEHLQSVFEGYIYPNKVDTVELISQDLTLLDMVKYGLNIEKGTTQSLNRIKDACESNDSNGTTYSFIVSMLREQCEEEAHYNDLIAQLKIAKDNPSAILFLDHELGEGENA